MLRETESFKIPVKERTREIPFLKLEEVDSTNDYLKRFAEKNPSEELLVTADYQTGGRGQFARKWESPRGENLLFSLLLHTAAEPIAMPRITTLTGQAVIETLQEVSGLPFELKPPNDVLLNGKKICGILTEQNTKGEKVLFVIVGVGININAEKEKLVSGATSLFAEKNEKYDKKKVLEVFLRHFFHKTWDYFGEKG